MFAVSDVPDSPCSSLRADLRQVFRIKGCVISATLPAPRFLTGGVFGVKCPNQHFFFLIYFFFFKPPRSLISQQVFFCHSLHHHHASPSLAAVCAPPTCQKNCDMWLLPAVGAGAALAPHYTPCYHRGFVPRSPEGSGFHIQPLSVASLDWNPGASGMEALHFMD